MIYLDNAATTPMDKDVTQAMLNVLENEYGNPSSVHKMGRQSKQIITSAREEIAKAINAKEREIFFTSCATEANNWVIKGVAKHHKSKGKHIITTKIEHHAVLHPCEDLEKEGFTVTYLDVNKDGIVELSELKKAITDETILISIMFANNEMGAIQPIKEIGKIAKEHDILFHTDAVQAFGHLEIDVDELNIDFLSLSGHKLYGPKGIGALYVRNGRTLKNLLSGGAQERGKRSGTENISGIAGLGVATKKAMENLQNEKEALTVLRDYTIDRILNEIPYSHLNGSRTERLPNNINISFSFVEGEAMLLMLDMKGICASSGSACTSGSLDPSHVLLALGLSHEEAHGSLRLSLSKYTTKEELDETVEALKQIIPKIRAMSPLYDDFIKTQGDK